MGLIDRLKKNSKIEGVNTMDKSKFFKEGPEYVHTSVPIINLCMSGFLTGGYVKGSTLFAGVSKNFKSNFVLLCVKAYFDQYPDAVCIFYDSEFGAPQDYFANFGLAPERILHTPVKNLEEFTFDIMTQLNDITETERVIIIVDSFGNIASKKEVDDALDGSDKQDMTRAKKMKGLFRMINPYLNMKNIPLFGIGHTYKTQDMYPKDVISGGTGSYYNSNNIFIVGREVLKDDKTKEILGFVYTLKSEKSRFVREGSKASVEVYYETGINQWSGLLDLALESGHVVSPKQGWYQKKGEEKSYRKKATNTPEFWLPILEDPTFSAFCENEFRIPSKSILNEVSDEEMEEELADV